MCLVTMTYAELWIEKGYLILFTVYTRCMPAALDVLWVDDGLLAIGVRLLANGAKRLFFNPQSTL